MSALVRVCLEKAGSFSFFRSNNDVGTLLFLFYMNANRSLFFNIPTFLFSNNSNKLDDIRCPLVKFRIERPRRDWKAGDISAILKQAAELFRQECHP